MWREDIRAELGGLCQQSGVWGGVDGERRIIAGLVRGYGVDGHGELVIAAGQQERDW